MTATGAEAGSEVIPAAPALPVAAADTESSSLTQRRRPRTLLIRATIGVILAVLATVAAWLLLRHGIRTDDFPPFLEGVQSTPITGYSGPWLTAAAAVALAAGLLLVFACRDLIRWSRARKASLG